MDEYYGENALHMAIVNEDPNMVKYLLSHNVNIHQRACGRFFWPDDKKQKRQESLYKEFPLLPLETNYAGLSYYGEYPLSFAAVMGQVDCMRLLFAHGVDPNKQDSNGNTVFHMLVIHNKLVLNLFLN
jgi:ankyrin repeat protein